MNLDSLPNSSTFLIGDSGYSDWFTGEIASFRIYSKVLNTSEISALYNEFNEDSGGSGSCNTGFLIDGLFLSSSEPKLGQKGLLLDNKYFLPLVEGYGGSAAEYYRCARVDISAKTWTGYKAVLNDGIYTFEDTVTTGLSYTSVTPQVGSIYSADTLVYGVNLYQGIPKDGLVFYAPLAEEKTTAETGQTLDYIGNSIVFENYKGKNSFKLDGTTSNYISSTLGSLETDFTVSFFCIERERRTFTQVGSYGSYFAFYDGKISLADKVHNLQTSTEATIDTWYFYAISRFGDTYTFYRDYDILQSGKDPDGEGFLFSENLILGQCASYSGGWEDFFGNIASFRIYKRALNLPEIHALAEEFTPTQTEETT